MSEAAKSDDPSIIEMFRAQIEKFEDLSKYCGELEISNNELQSKNRTLEIKNDYLQQISDIQYHQMQESFKNLNGKITSVEKKLKKSKRKYVTTDDFSQFKEKMKSVLKEMKDNTLYVAEKEKTQTCKIIQEMSLATMNFHSGSFNVNQQRVVTQDDLSIVKYGEQCNQLKNEMRKLETTIDKALENVPDFLQKKNLTDFEKEFADQAEKIQQEINSKLKE